MQVVAIVAQSAEELVVGSDLVAVGLPERHSGLHWQFVEHLPCWHVFALSRLWPVVDQWWVVGLRRFESTTLLVRLLSVGSSTVVLGNVVNTNATSY